MSLWVDVPGANDTFCSVGKRTFTEEQATAVFKRIAEVNVNGAVRVTCGTNASAIQLVSLLSALQQAGLRNILIYDKGSRLGSNGVYQLFVSCQSTNLLFSTCEGFERLGFVPDSPEERMPLAPNEVRATSNASSTNELNR